MEIARLDANELAPLANTIRPHLIRYPAVDPADLEQKLAMFLIARRDQQA